MSEPSESAGEVLFETIRIGAVLRIAAIHAESGVEVVIQVPAGTSPSDAQALALRKLQRALERTANDQQVKPKTGQSGKLV